MVPAPGSKGAKRACSIRVLLPDRQPSSQVPRFIGHTGPKALLRVSVLYTGRLY